MPFYVASQIEDIYTVGLDLYVTKWDGSPLEGAIVEVEGQSGITNKKGLVTFYKLPYNISLEIKLSHPSMGMGDTQHIFIPESAKGTHVTHALFFTKPKRKENLGVRIGLTGIEWQGTIFEHARLVEELSPHINLGIEWESLGTPELFPLEQVRVQTDLDIDWVAIDIEYRQPKESISVSIGLTNILWVGLTE